MARSTHSSVFDWLNVPVLDISDWIDDAVTVAKEEAAQSGR
jgi:hypothetical protein